MVDELDLIIKLPKLLLANLNYIYCLMLLIARYIGFFLVVPGLGQGNRGLMIRVTSIFLFSVISLSFIEKPANIPNDFILFSAKIIMELAWGFIFGFIPFLIVAAVQSAGQIASVTMGLGAGQLIDPSTGVSIAQIGILFGNIMTLLILSTDYHLYLIYCLQKINEIYPPGEIPFIFFSNYVELLISESGKIFEIIIVISSPVIFIVLISQFILGILTRIIPQLNVFILSLPLTILGGLFLLIISFPALILAFQNIITKNILFLQKIMPF